MFGLHRPPKKYVRLIAFHLVFLCCCYKVCSFAQGSGFTAQASSAGIVNSSVNAKIPSPSANETSIVGNLSEV